MELSYANVIDRPRDRIMERRLEKLVFWHVIILIVGLAWAFGGQAPWARMALRLWGSVGITLFISCAGVRGLRTNPAIRELWPFLLFDLIVALSCLNPSFKSIVRDGETYLALITPPHEWLPSSARPDLSWRELWQLNGIVLSLYNLRLAMRSRRIIRNLLYVAILNAAVLAVFGTFQKLVGAPGLWFGLVPSPQKYFFATFVYHNHWSAFNLLNLGICLALLFHHLRRSGHRDIWHSPVVLIGFGAFLLTITAPLSASRSGTALATLFIFGAGAHFLVRLVRSRRARHESAAPPVIAAAAAALLAIAVIGFLARNVVRHRTAITIEQLTQIRQDDGLNTRFTLYRDTWELALRKPWFGWGLETYGDVFRIFNTQPTVLRGGIKPYYREAHNDWLQSLAEVGFVGTGLLILTGMLVLRHIRWWRPDSLIVGYLLASCGLILAYAWVEFPFANPSVLVGFCFNLFAAVRYIEFDPTTPA